jgi:hypothetical protein
LEDWKIGRFCSAGSLSHGRLCTNFRKLSTIFRGEALKPWSLEALKPWSLEALKPWSLILCCKNLHLHLHLHSNKHYKITNKTKKLMTLKDTFL